MVAYSLGTGRVNFDRLAAELTVHCHESLVARAFLTCEVRGHPFALTVPARRIRAKATLGPLCPRKSHLQFSAAPRAMPRHEAEVPGAVYDPTVTMKPRFGIALCAASLFGADEWPRRSNHMLMHMSAMHFQSVLRLEFPSASFLCADEHSIPSPFR